MELNKIGAYHKYGKYKYMSIVYLGSFISHYGNIKFEDKQKISLEFNGDTELLHFFLFKNDITGEVYLKSYSDISKVNTDNFIFQTVSEKYKDSEKNMELILSYFWKKLIFDTPLTEKIIAFTDSENCIYSPIKKFQDLKNTYLEWSRFLANFRQIDSII